MAIPPTADAPTNCQETAGFLFSHACKNPAVNECVRCKRRICPMHTRFVKVAGASMTLSGTEHVCITCRNQQDDYEVDSDDPFDYSYRTYSDYDQYDDMERYSRSDRAPFDNAKEGEGDGKGDDMNYDKPDDDGWEDDFDAS
jgi:hypothetical protein